MRGDEVKQRGDDGGAFREAGLLVLQSLAVGADLRGGEHGGAGEMIFQRGDGGEQRIRGGGVEVPRRVIRPAAERRAAGAEQRAALNLDGVFFVPLDESGGGDEEVVCLEGDARVGDGHIDGGDGRGVRDVADADVAAGAFGEVLIEGTDHMRADQVVRAVVRRIARDEGERGSIRCLDVEVKDAVASGEVGERVRPHASGGTSGVVILTVLVAGVAVFEIRNAGGPGGGGARHADIDAVSHIAGEQHGIRKTPGHIALAGQRHRLRESLRMQQGEGVARDSADAHHVGLCGVRFGARCDAVGDGSQPKRSAAGAEGLALGGAGLRAGLHPPFVRAIAWREIRHIKAIHRRCGRRVRDGIHRRSRPHDERDAAIVFQIADVPGVDARSDIRQVQARRFIAIAIEITGEIVATGKGRGGEARPAQQLINASSGGSQRGRSHGEIAIEDQRLAARARKAQPVRSSARREIELHRAARLEIKIPRA